MRLIELIFTLIAVSGTLFLIGHALAYLPFLFR
jgi:hypothetical protein